MAMETSCDYSLSVPETASTTGDQPTGSTAIANASSNDDTRAQAGSEIPKKIDIITFWSLLMKTYQEKFVQCVPYLQRLEFDGDPNQILDRIASLSVSDNDEVFLRAVKPLADVLRRGAIEKEYFDRLAIADAASEETVDTTQRGNRRPDDPQDLNTNHAIQQNETRKLSELLSKTQIILNELNSVQLNISEQPKLFWHSRYLTCLLNGMCSGLRGRTDDQEKFIFLEWLNLNGFDLENVFIRAQILTFDGQIHPTKHIVPPGTKVNDAQQNESLTLKDVLVDEQYGFDERMKELFYRLQPETANPEQMNFKVLVFNQPRSEKSKRGSDAPWTKIFTIRFQLFYLTEGKLQSISNAIDTQLVEESKQTHELEVIKAKFVDGQPPAVEVIFNTDAAKDGFHVFIDGEELAFHKFPALKSKIMLIKSDAFENDCRLRITRSSAMETIRQGRNPRNDLVQKILYEGDVEYLQSEENNRLSANSQRQLCFATQNLS